MHPSDSHITRIHGLAGGALGLANACRKLASTPQRAQLMCWTLGVGIFYDDYSCVLITGNALRPIAQLVQLSPEKFAYILHSCAMLPSLMPVSSWVCGCAAHFFAGILMSFSKADVVRFIRYLSRCLVIYFISPPCPTFCVLSCTPLSLSPPRVSCRSNKHTALQTYSYCRMLLATDMHTSTSTVASITGGSHHDLLPMFLLCSTPWPCFSTESFDEIVGRYCMQVGVELGYLQQQYQSLGIQKNAFVVLMETVPYRMYPVLCIVMALLVCAHLRASRLGDIP